MKLQPDLIRDILIWCEENLSHESVIIANQIKIDRYTSDEIIYHCEILKDAGYILGKPLKSFERRDVVLYHLTLEGHQLLDLVRNENFWNRISNFLEKAGIKPLPIIIQFLETILLAKLGIN